jgi:uncharacterized membrane protein
MKALYIVLGIWILITGICTIAGVCELDQVTAGLYVTCYGLFIILEGLKAGRNK